MSDTRLDDLLEEGLDIWIADYHVARKGGSEMADVILQGIEKHKERLNENDKRRLEGLLNERNYTLPYRDYDEEKVNEAFRLIGESENQMLTEGIFKKIAGGAAGFAAGPAIGKAICNALGIERNSLLWDFFTSRMAGSSLGAALADLGD